jgi:hypothetical protein
MFRQHGIIFPLANHFRDFQQFNEVAQRIWEITGLQ